MRLGRVGRSVALALLPVVAMGAMPGSVFADSNVAPSVTSWVTPSTATEPQTVTAHATFTDPDSTSFTCTVNYGDNTFVAGVVFGNTCTGPAHRYAATWQYVGFVQVTDDQGASGVWLFGVNYTNLAPYLVGLGLVGYHEVGKPGHAVVAIENPGSESETYVCTSIDYGDGSPLASGTLVRDGWSDGLPRCVFPDHVYSTAGTVTLTAVVTDGGGLSASEVFNEVIAPADPGFSVQAPPTATQVTEGQEASLWWAIVDQMPDLPYSIHVDWGDGSSQNLSMNYTTAQFSVQHTYAASAGNVCCNGWGSQYSPTLTVTDAAGFTASASQTVYVQNLAPVITAPAAIHMGEGTSGTITLATFSDPSTGPWNVLILAANGAHLQEQFTAPGPITVPWDATQGATVFTVYVMDQGNLYSTVTIPLIVDNVAPVVGTVSVTDASGGPPVQGSPAVVRATFADPGLSSWPTPESFTCTIDFGDGAGPQPGQVGDNVCQAVHTFTRAGSKTVTVTVTDANGGSGSTSATVNVGSTAPQVGPVVVPESLVEGQAFVATANFTASNPRRCTVDFGDGSGTPHGTISGSTCSAPNYAYPAAGTYTLTFTITDASGATGSASVTVVVGNTAPVVENAQTWGTPSVGGTVTAHATFHDPALGIETYTCAVDFGDGSGPQPGVIGDVDCTADHTYSEGGLYTVTVTVTDSNGGSGSASTSLPVANRRPTVGPISISGSAVEGGSVQASASFTDPWSVANFNYCVIDYGDGSGSNLWITTDQTCVAPGHNYTGPGTYTISLTVDRGYGEPGTSTTTITVANVAPTVSRLGIVSYGPSGVAESPSVSFLDPGYGQGESYTCTIDYGDGTGAQTGVISDDRCTGPAHSYVSKGTYALVATVTDSNGAAGTYSVPIVIYNPDPSVGPVWAPASAQTGTAVTASAAYTATGQVPADTCTVDYGDGTGPQAATANGTTCIGPSHKYAVAGTFTITVEVLAATGSSASSSTTIKVYSLGVGAVSVSGSLTEGSSVTASAGFTPVGFQTYTCKVDYGDGTSIQTGTISGTTCKGPSHKYGRPGTFTVAVSVTGSKGNAGSSSRTIDIANVMPVVTATLPSTAKVGTSVTLSASFTDPGTTETYQVVVDWGDGTRVPIQLGRGRSFTASHTYTRAGGYGVVVEVSDDQMAQVATAALGIAVYDPARTLSGSGTFASPAGACTFSSKCAGASTATFSVSASYARGATKPTATFTFSAAGISFTATSFNTYMVTEGVGVLDGSGKLNGVSGYRFGVFSVDGTPDKILVSIFDSNGNSVYYNNDYTPLKTGSIVMR